MRPILLALALLAVSTARAEEPSDKLGTGAIAEACAREFPDDPEAAKACEVVVRIDIRRKREGTLEYHSNMILRLFDLIDQRIAELEARVSRLESFGQQEQVSSPRSTDELACENTTEYPTREERRACRGSRDAGLNFIPVPK